MQRTPCTQNNAIHASPTNIVVIFYLKSPVLHLCVARKLSHRQFFTSFLYTKVYNIPSNCNLPGNEAADSLAREGTRKEQVDRSTNYPEVKTILMAKLMELK